MEKKYSFFFTSLAEQFSFGFLLLFDYICSQKGKGLLTNE